MNKEPIQNDQNNPLISIFIYNYAKQHLRQCLESIFQQEVLKNFEIILIDDATLDGSWDIALEYLHKYQGIITASRNRKVLGPRKNLDNCLKMAKGQYSVALTDDRAFIPDYVKNCVQTMRADPYAQFHLVRRISNSNIQPLHNMNKPLVSILCYNYNYGRYLRQCLESVFSQTYENIELCFSDNASTDESWEIALEYAQKYPEKMYLTCNRKNFGPDDNFANCIRNAKGEYFINFCSDDALEPDYVERCVNVMEAHPNVGLVIVNRAIIDEHSRRKEEPPFYNQSCIIPGEEQAAVYMMAGVNPSVSQIMYRTATALNRSSTGGLVTRYYGTRILDFNISVDFDIGFIKKPLLLHRIHSLTDTSKADTNLLPVLAWYVLNHQLSDIASYRNLKKLTDRLPQSLDKLAKLAVRYSVRSLLADDEPTALRYFHLASAISPVVEEDPSWKKLQEYWTADAATKAQMIDQFRTSDNLATRNISYDPPPGSMPIDKKGDIVRNSTENKNFGT